ncbi:MAG: hypothetical protein ALAOOOJD_01413 [bacterium]|nr:hypothetical protein [bacterium]
MISMSTFRPRWFGIPRKWQPAGKRMAMLFLLVACSVRAGDNGREKARDFYYQPYTDAEIKAAVQKPLTLNDCIRIALSQNIALRISQGEFDRAAAQHAGSYGRFLPVFSIDGTRANTLDKSFTLDEVEIDDSTNVLVNIVEKDFSNNTNIAGKAQLFLPTGATVQFSSDLARSVQYPFENPTIKNRDRGYAFSLNQPLLRDAGTTVARSSFLGTGYDQRIEERNLLNRKLQTVFVVKRVYFVALQQRAIVKVNESAFIKDSVLVEASKALTVAKLATRRDVLSAEIRFADDKASLLASQSDYQLALDNLKDAMGLPIDMVIELDATDLSYSPIVLDEPALVREALENNPLIHSAEIGISRSRLQRSLAKNSLLPQLDLVASYSADARRSLVSNRDLNRSGGWQASLNLSYPFLNREAAAKAEDAEIAVTQQELRLLEVQRQTMIDVRDIVRGVYSAAEQIKAIQHSIVIAQDKFDFATTMFNLGRASNFDITDAQEFLLKAQNGYLRKLVDYHTQLALLESLVGRPIAP